MGYNGSIFVLVFSTSNFMTWGTTFCHCTCIFHINLYDMRYNSSVIVLVFSTSNFMTWGVVQSLWHGVQRFYLCTCIFHIKLYDMGYNGSIFVLVFSTSNFMIWGTTVLSLYLYFPHQSLWHGVQRFYHCTCIFHINLYDTPHDNLIVYKCLKRFIEQSMKVKSIEIFSGMSLTNCIK